MFHCLRRSYSNTLETKAGEWIVDTYPNLRHILDHKEALIDSLLKRIYASSEADAQAIVSGLEARYNHYKECVVQRDQLDKRLKEIMKQKKCDNVFAPQLEFMEVKEELREWKTKTDNAEKQVLAVFSGIPNFISSIGATNLSNIGKIQSESYLKNLIDGCRTEKKVNSSSFQLEYQVGAPALLNLELSGCISEYLVENKFTEVTAPAFIRQDVVEKLGLNYQDKNTYTLLTKAEMHDDDRPGSRFENIERQRKSEDHDVYKAFGLYDTSLLLYFIRQTIPRHVLPLNIFAVGNQYRLPYGGKPVQSKVAVIVSAAESHQAALTLFENNIKLVGRFWANIGVDVQMKMVEPHLLAHHEAAAVECEMITPGHHRPVISRLTLSNDYISRKMMASYGSSVAEDKFLYFTSGEFADINIFIESLQNVQDVDYV